GYMYDSDAVLAKKSLRLSGQKNLKLPHSALDIGDGKSWIIVTGAVSYAVGVRLTLPGGEPIYAYSTHLVASSEADRRDQLASLNSALQKRVSEEGGDWSTAKVILGGDFNSGPKAPGPLFMRAQGYQDTWLSAHASEAADPGFTNCMQWWTACYNPFTLGSGQFPEQDLPDPDTRIDYIYTHGKGMTVRSSAVEFTSPYDGVWMSDHYGVVSTIGVDEGADAIAVANVPPQSALPPPAFLNVTEDLFECDDWRYGCRATLAETVVEGSRGLTIRDGTKGELNIHIRGPGRVFTSPDAQLSDGQYASFVFDRAGIYTLKMDDGDEDRIVGRIRVQKGLAE
ncbi:MAG: endonuclease/exonuclease/phosphatase family protein, partial [Bdellovibrionota bacterium]